MKFLWVGCVAVFCASAAAASVGDQVTRLEQLGVDVQGVATLIERMDAQGVPAEVQEIHLDRLATLAFSNLPVPSVLNRYLEGFAKGIPLSRIEGVTQALALRLVEAAQYVDVSAQKAEVDLSAGDRLEAIDQASYAMGVGVVETDLSRSLDMACLSLQDGYNWNSPLITMSVLVSAGIPSDRSFEVLHAAWDKGFRGRELELLGRAVAGFDHSAEAVDVVMDLLVTDHSLDAVFQNLETLQGAPQNGFTPGEIHDPPSGRHILPRKDRDPSPVSPSPVVGRS